MTDILKCILDPQLSWPQFCCTNLERMPSVSADHVDVAAMCVELSQLRSEVREMVDLRNELRSLKAAINDLHLSNFPPLQTTSDIVEVTNQVSVNDMSAPSATDIVRAAVQSGALHRQRPINKAVIGSKVNQSINQ